MKRAILIVYLLTFAGFVSMAQQVLMKGLAVAEIKPSGDVYIAEKSVGFFDTKTGDVYKKGELVGQIRKNGEFWRGGFRAGYFDFDGSVYSSTKAKLGKVEMNGDIFDKDEKIASGKGIKREWLVGVFFFYFRDEVLQ